MVRINVSFPGKLELGSLGYLNQAGYLIVANKLLKIVSAKLELT